MTSAGASRTRLPAGVASAAVAVLVACSSPSTVVLPLVEVVVASGDSQYGTVGQSPVHPLRVVVRTLSGRIPQASANVLWEVIEGDASLIDIATTVTDSTGSTQMRVRFGASTGEVVVRAMAESENRPSAMFRLFVVDRPVLDGLEPVTAAPGEPVVLTGSNFSTDPDENVVLFSGVRGRVTSATRTRLEVVVPSCLPPRSVLARVQLGVVASGELPLTVGPGGTLVSLPVGGVVDVADDGGFTCLGLQGGGEYLTVVYSASTVGAATHPFTLTGLSAGSPLQTPVLARHRPRPSTAGRGLRADGVDYDAQTAWDLALREIEEQWIDERSALRPPAPGAGPALTPQAAPPVVGERRTFNVFQATGEFAEITARAAFVGDEVALFVDEAAPLGGFSPGDLRAFADRFDDVIHPAVTGLFGETSDLDGNERVVVLFTPAVNALTPRGASGFVGGFFFGVDLLPERAGSNDGEIFYTLVPDPSGQFSDPRTKDAVLRVTPAVLAHEFQHMVHFNERILVRQAESTEAVWLSEALAQFAEEVVAADYEVAGDAVSAELFRSGAQQRARRYLTGPDTVALIISTGQGSLAERGAGFLYMTYLEDQFGADLVRRLTRTTETGVQNIELETGRAWEDVLVDWFSAVYLDGPDPESGALVYPDFDLRGFVGDPFPLDAERLGGGDFDLGGSLWSASAGYYIVVPSSPGSTALRLGGEAGGVSTEQAELRMRVIRVS